VARAGGQFKTLAELCGDTFPGETTPRALEKALERLDDAAGIDLFVIRGEQHLGQLARNEAFASRTWGYWLGRPDIVEPWREAALGEVAGRINRILVQSEASKALLESVFGVPAERVLALPPMLPDEAWHIATTQPRTGLVYSGKLDKQYNVETYLALPHYFALHGSQTTLHFIGDKFNRAAGDSTFGDRMRGQLENTEGVVWHKGMERRAALGLMAQALFGLCWRDRNYDTSLEISTKLLEFCALGVPPLVNKTEVNVELLGDDYPYFVAGLSDIHAAYRRAVQSPEEYQRVSARLRSLARRFSFKSAAASLQRELSIAGFAPHRAAPTHEAPRRRVLIASHDNKFLQAALERLGTDSEIEIRHDKWPTLRRHDQAKSRELLEWADVVFCEWCGGAAVWYSQRVSERQKCYVRLHRFEAFEEATREVNFANVERLIVVSDHFKELCAGNFGVDKDRIDVIPQHVDWRQFNRPKHPWAQFTLGLVGINGYFHKRFDRALDILAALRASEPQWRLRIRSVMPWAIDWVWARKDEVAQFRQQFARILADPLLRDAVLFDPAGSDMAEWFRHVGFILSTSDSEGCHTSVAEGMASGATPAIYHWPGAASVYPREFVFDTVDEMVEHIRRSGARDDWASERARVADLARPFDMGATVARLRSLFTAKLQ
jgi:glycosyltransferase involved in cell wall biosynthesis